MEDNKNNKAMNDNLNDGFVRVITDLVNSKSWIDRASLVPDLMNSFVFKNKQIITRDCIIKLNQDKDVLFVNEDMISLPSSNYRLMEIRRTYDSQGFPSFEVGATKQRGYTDDLSKFFFFTDSVDKDLFYVLSIRHDCTQFYIDNIEDSIVKLLFADFFTSGEPLSPTARSISRSVLYFRAFGGFIIEYLPADSLDSFVDSAVVDKGFLKALAITGSAEVPLFNTFDKTTPVDIISRIKNSTTGQINFLLNGSYTYISPEDKMIIKKQKNTNLKQDIIKFFSDIKLNKNSSAPYANIQINNDFSTLSYDQEAILCILHKIEDLSSCKNDVLIYASGIEDLFAGELYYFDDTVDIYNETTTVLSRLIKELDKVSLYREQLKYNIVYAYKSILQRELDSIKDNLIFTCEFRDGLVYSIHASVDDNASSKDSIIEFHNMPVDINEEVISPVFVTIINHSIKGWSEQLQSHINCLIRPNTNEQVEKSFYENIVNPKKIALEAFKNSICIDDFNNALQIITGGLTVAKDISRQFDTALYSSNQALDKVTRHDFQFKNGDYGYQNCNYDKYKNGRFELANAVPDVTDVRLLPLGNNIRLDFDIPTRAVEVMAPDDSSTSKSKTDAIDVYNKICHRAWEFINTCPGKKEGEGDTDGKPSPVVEAIKKLFSPDSKFSVNNISYYIYQYKVNFPESSYRNYGEYIWEHPSNNYRHDCHIENRIKVSISIKMDIPSLKIDKNTGVEAKKAQFVQYLCDEFGISKENTNIALVLDAFDSETQAKLQTVVDNFSEKQKLIDYINVSSQNFNQSALFLTDLYGRKRLVDKKFLSVLPFVVGNMDKDRQINRMCENYSHLELGDGLTLGMLLDAKGLSSCYKSPYEMKDIENATGTQFSYQDVLLAMFIDSL